MILLLFVWISVWSIPPGLSQPELVFLLVLLTTVLCLLLSKSSRRFQISHWYRTVSLNLKQIGMVFMKTCLNWTDLLYIGRMVLWIALITVLHLLLRDGFHQEHYIFVSKTNLGLMFIVDVLIIWNMKHIICGIKTNLTLLWQNYSWSPNYIFFFFFFFFMNGNTERAKCALSRVCIPWKKERKCNKTIL